MTDTTPQMPDNPAPERKNWLPQLRSRWWTALLGLSLMLNLLIAGMYLGFGFSGNSADRIVRSSYVQMIPRKFLADLPRERRRELMRIVRSRAQDLRALRENSDASPLKLAAALEKETVDPVEIRAAVDAFTTGSESLAAAGGEIVMEIVGKLTPEERKLLAAAIRDRAERQTRRKKK